MAERLSPLELSLLARPSSGSPGLLATVAVFEPPSPTFAADELAAGGLVNRVTERIAYVPRYRQRVQRVAGGLLGAVWVDDEAFDATSHVQTSTLAAPGTDRQLQEFVTQRLSVGLDASRPLWALHLVRGLDGGRFALVEVVHPAVVDGIDTVDLLQVLIDNEPSAFSVASGWHPQPTPPPLELLGRALWRARQDPIAAADDLRQAFSTATSTTSTRGAAALGPGLLATPGEALAVASMPLADLQSVATAQGVTVHDVVLALVTGALRAIRLARFEVLAARTTAPALVPVAVVEDEQVPTALGSQVVTGRQRLPVGEPDALVRLQLLAWATGRARTAARATGARNLSELAGFAPPTLHALAARAVAAAGDTGLRVVDVPGPQQRRFLGPAELAGSYSVVPDAAGGVAVTSYCGQLFFGVRSDATAPGDAELLAQGLRQAGEELVARSAAGDVRASWRGNQ